MILSRSCDHAIRASLYIALQADRAFVPIREIASALEISFHFLTKILQLLTQARIMASFKGPNGGVTLARPAAAISLKEIVLAIDGNRIFNGCMIGLDHCDDDHPCPYTINGAGCALIWSSFSAPQPSPTWPSGSVRTDSA
ncbi:MAG TPA: Rrf2 family transcriptional regulator [bacterium]|nr:Rrf2 family transcriptional regulator [bacterium]